MVGFGTTKLTRVGEPALLWNQLLRMPWEAALGVFLGRSNRLLATESSFKR